MLCMRRAPLRGPGGRANDQLLLLVADFAADAACVFKACGHRDGLHMVNEERRRASARSPVPGRVASGFAAGASSEMRDVRNGLRRDATIGFDDDRDDSVALDEERVAVGAALLFNIATARVVVERIIARAAAFTAAQYLYAIDLFRIAKGKTVAD